MKCSLIIMVYNDIKTLSLTFEALKIQTEKDFEVIIEHEDFVRIFRFARMLSTTDQYNWSDVETLTASYVEHLGYQLSKEELREGILVWVERFDDVDDEEIEDWIN